MKSKFYIIIACSIVLLLSLQFLLLSISFNDITDKIVGNNPFMSLFGTISSISVFIYPILVFIFLIVSIHLMLDIFDIKHVSKYEIITLVGFSTIPLLLGMLFYNVSVLFFMQDNPITIKDIEKARFLFNLQIKDFGLINKICWFLMYYMIIMFLYLKYKLSIVHSLAISIVPSILLLFFSYLIKFFSAN